MYTCSGMACCMVQLLGRCGVLALTSVAVAVAAAPTHQALWLRRIAGHDNLPTLEDCDACESLEEMRDMCKNSIRAYGELLAWLKLGYTESQSLREHSANVFEAARVFCAYARQMESQLPAFRGVLLGAERHAAAADAGSVQLGWAISRVQGPPAVLPSSDDSVATTSGGAGELC